MVWSEEYNLSTNLLHSFRIGVAVAALPVDSDRLVVALGVFELRPHDGDVEVVDQGVDEPREGLP